MQLNKKYQHLDTKSLIDKCISGDPLAWSEFIYRFSPLIYRAIRKRLEAHTYKFNKEDIEDLRQELFVKLWRDKSLEKLKGAQNVNYWLCLVSANFATDFYRKTKKDLLKNASSIYDELVTNSREHFIRNFLNSTAADPREKLNIKMLEEKINNTLSELNPKEQIALKLNIFHGMKYREIADTLKVSVGNLSSILNRSKVKIRKALQENI